MGKGNEFRHARRKPAPISSHPAFATLVALWFAALLGLGSLFLSIQPLERVLGPGGLGAASPFIHPALKLVVAIVAGLLGFRLGRLVARIVAARQSGASREDRAAARAPTMRDIGGQAKHGPRQPIIAHEELGEGLGPVADGAFEDGFGADEPPVPDRIDSPWLGDEDGHMWSEELADAPLTLSEDDTPAESTAPIIAERPLAELGMVELIERLAHAIQSKQGLARCLPADAAETVRRLEADVQASNAAYASLTDIRNLAPPAFQPPAAQPAVIFPAADTRRAGSADGGALPARAARESAGREGPDKEGDALRSALETLRRMSGTA